MTAPASNEQMFGSRPFVFKAVVERIIGHHAPVRPFANTGSAAIDVKVTKHVAVTNQIGQNTVP